MIDSPGTSQVADKLLEPPELYWLDLLLTADPVHAESAMLEALGCLDKGPASLPSYVGQAINYMRSDLDASIERAGKEPSSCEQASVQPNGADYNLQDLAQAIATIDTFPRCVLVLRLAARMTMGEISACLRVSTHLLKQVLATALVNLDDNLRTDQARPSRNVLTAGS